MINLKLIGLLASAAGVGLNLVSGWVEDQKTQAYVREEVARQLSERNTEEEESDETEEDEE